MVSNALLMLTAAQVWMIRPAPGPLAFWACGCCGTRCRARRMAMLAVAMPWRRSGAKIVLAGHVAMLCHAALAFKPPETPPETLPWWQPQFCMFFRWFQQSWPASLRVKIDCLWPRRSVWACCAVTSTAGRKYWASMVQLGRKQLILAWLGSVMLGATLVSMLFMWVIVTFTGIATWWNWLEVFSLLPFPTALGSSRGWVTMVHKLPKPSIFPGSSSFTVRSYSRSPQQKHAWLCDSLCMSAHF